MRFTFLILLISASIYGQRFPYASSSHISGYAVMDLDTLFWENFEDIPLGQYDTADFYDSYGGTLEHGSGILDPQYWAGLGNWQPTAPTNDSNLWVVDSVDNKFLWGRYRQDEYGNVVHGSDETGSGWSYRVDLGDTITEVWRGFLVYLYPGHDPETSGKWMNGFSAKDYVSGGDGCDWDGGCSGGACNGFRFQLAWYAGGGTCTDTPCLTWYAYYYNMPKPGGSCDSVSEVTYGETINWKDPDNLENNYVMPTGEWVFILQRLVLNSATGSSDGEIWGYINGKFSVKKTGLRLMRSFSGDRTGLLTWFYGGGSGFEPDNDNYMRMDEDGFAQMWDELGAPQGFGSTDSSDQYWPQWNTYTGQPIFSD